MKTLTTDLHPALGGLMIAFVLAFTSHSAWAQEGGGTDKPDQNRVGTAGAVELLVPLTARYVALGATTTSSLADMNGLEALYANPAGLVNNSGTSALFSRMNYVADIGVSYFGFAQRLGSDNHLAVAVSSWEIGDIARQSELAPEKSDVTFNVSFVAVGLTYAKVLTDRISAGGTIKIVNESIDDVSASGVVFDAGMTYVVGETGLRVGVALKNIGNQLQFDGVGLTRRVQLPSQPGNATVNAVKIESEAMEYPTLLNFGMAYTRQVAGAASLTVLGNFRSNSFEQDQFSGGLELGFRGMLFLRGGYEYVADSDVSMWKGYTFGAGLNLDLQGTGISIDYAMAPTDYFDDVQFLTVAATL